MVVQLNTVVDQTLLATSDSDERTISRLSFNKLWTKVQGHVLFPKRATRYTACAIAIPSSCDYRLSYVTIHSLVAAWCPLRISLLSFVE